jgi:hypothetical protein
LVGKGPSCGQLDRLSCTTYRGRICRATAGLNDDPTSQVSLLLDQLSRCRTLACEGPEGEQWLPVSRAPRWTCSGELLPRLIQECGRRPAFSSEQAVNRARSHVSLMSFITEQCFAVARPRISAALNPAGPPPTIRTSNFMRNPVVACTDRVSHNAWNPL